MAATSEIRVLLVEDDPRVSRAVQAGLEADPYRLYYAGTLKQARSLLAFRDYHALILDIGLPDGSGLELARELRTLGNEIPILILTAREGLQDRLTGFGEGADDYLTKPFEPSELDARLKAVLRRARAQERSQLNYADVELDLLTLTMRRGSVSTTLSAREFELLAYLMKHSEEVLSRDRLLEEVWGAEADGDSNVVNVYVNYLRNKLEQAGGPRLIHTVRGAGYILSKADPEELL